MVNYTSLSIIVGGIGYDRVLNWLGFSNITSDSSAVRSACVVHGGDRKDSFCLYKNTLVWRCFSNKCNETHGSDFFSLVRAIFKCSFSEAVDKFCTEFSINKSSFYDNNLDDSHKKDAMFLSYLKHANAVEYDISDIDINIFPCDYFLKSPPKGGGPFTKEILDFFEISGCYVDDFNIKRVLIPIYDYSGVLAGYSGRATTKVKERKYLLMGNMVAGDVLYNLNKIKNIQSDYIIVVEGFKSVWRLYEYGYTNVVCCMGSILTPHQVKLLIKSLKKVVLFLDADTAGIQGTIIVNNKYNKTLPIIPIISDFERDPADLTKDEADKILIKYKPKNESYV